MRLNGICRLILLLLLLGTSRAGAQMVLLDDFTRVNNTVAGNGWVETETVASTAITINSSLLRMGSATAGRDYVYKDVSAAYNTVFNTNTGILTWGINMRQSRPDPSGFDGSNYGIAFVLGCNSNDFNTGSGYAVVLGNSGTSDNLRLVRFTNGMDGNTNMTNIIAPAVDYGADYLTVKVTYNPVGDNWTLYVGNVITSFSNPSTAGYTQLGATTSDGTYTGSDLLYLGCYWNHATSATDYGYFDNVWVPNLCSIAPEPMVNSSTAAVTFTGANSVQMSWTRGDGSVCIVIGHKNGAVVTTPVDGATYIANSTFGLGTLMAANEYVVYAGSGNSVTVNGLTPLTNYEFRVFEYNGTGCTNNYLLPAPAIANVSTIACIPDTEPTSPSSNPLIVSGLTSSIQLAWTRGNGSYCIVVCKAGSAVTAVPTDGVSYSANSVFGTGGVITAGEYVVYSGTAATVTVTGLLSSTTYYFSIFEMNGTGCNTNYLTSPAATITGATSVTSAYNLYFGNLHSHSDYSDGDLDNVCNGSGSAYCCYDIGNTAQNFDFMGISDHNHNEGPVMTTAKYASGLTEADNYNSTHADFTALFGMEWGTISTGGHVGVYGVDQLVGWNSGNYNVYCAKGDYSTLFNLVASTSGAFATLCHPNSTDFGNIANTAYNGTFDNAIVAVALKNGPYNSVSTSYNDPSSGNNSAYYKTLLSKGYHLGPTVDLDNHNSATMGKCSQGRTAILATSLSKATITDAMLNMRFYATEDYNLNVNFNMNGVYPMGSIITGTTVPWFTVSTNDPDGEMTTLIRVWFGVPGSGMLPGVLASNINAPSISFSHNVATGSFYYFAEIVQADGNITWTSPIWYTKLTSPLPIQLLSFTGRATHNGNELEWITATELNNDYFTLQRSRDGIIFENIVNVPGAGTSLSANKYTYLDTDVESGNNYYRLQQTDFDGRSSFSEIILIKSATSKNPFSIYPNPGNGVFIITSSDPQDYESIAVYDLAGRKVETKIETNGTGCILTMPAAASGIYLLQMFSENSMHTVKVSVNNTGN
jgi:hypothetical protein